MILCFFRIAEILHTRTGNFFLDVVQLILFTIHSKQNKRVAPYVRTRFCFKTDSVTSYALHCVSVPWPAEDTENRCNPVYVQFQHCLWLEYESVSVVDYNTGSTEGGRYHGQILKKCLGKITSAI